MNCRLYQKECKQTGTSKVRGHAREQTEDLLATTQDVVINHHGDSTASSCAVFPSDLLNPPDPTSAPHAHDLAMGRQPMNGETMNGEMLTLHVPDPLIATDDPNDYHQPMLQLEDMFANEVLRSNIPLHDFSFLGDFVHDAPMSLDTHFTETHHLSSETGLYREQAGTPHSKPTPISSYSQQGDKIAGLGSLRPDTELQSSGSHIPPGLFIGIENTQTGFIGECPLIAITANKLTSGSRIDGHRRHTSSLYSRIDEQACPHSFFFEL